MFQGIRQKIRYAMRDAASNAGWQPSLLKQARGARIVVYHGICQNDHTRFNNIFLTLKTFESHLAFYRKHFNVLSLDDYFEGRFSDDRFNICISFDDGYANNHKYVLPLLERYEIPAAFFITGVSQEGHDILWNDFLGIFSKYGPSILLYDRQFYRKGRFNRYLSVVDGRALVERLRDGGFGVKDEMIKTLSSLLPFRDEGTEEDYWRQMTRQQIADLSASRWVTIGAHGYYHNDLARISPGEAKLELKRSKQYLEELTGKEIRSLAFPYGTYKRDTVAAAKEMNFSRLFALDFHFPEDHSDPSMRERFIVNPFISAGNQMLATIKKTYAF
ncbi:MAG: polysaccharide deacetylase family protein [Puia sp.]|nr:polysaccharide deacetylase family protein [Puia sp.]